MKRISHKKVIGQCSMYQKGKHYFIEQPKGTIVKYYLKDDNGSIVAVVGRKRHYGAWAILFLSIWIFYLFHLVTKESHIVRIPDEMYYSNQVLGMNILNDSKNTKAVKISLYDEKGREQIEPINLQPGQSIGNVKLLEDISDGSYMWTMLYEIEAVSIDKVQEYTILVIAERKWDMP